MPTEKKPRCTYCILGTEFRAMRVLENGRQICEHRRPCVLVTLSEMVHAMKTVSVGADGKECLALKPAELIRIIELTHKMHRELLGNPEEDQVAKIEVHFGSTEDEEAPDSELPL